MIGKLTGRLEHRGTDHVMIDVGGIGYLVYCNERTLASLPPTGETVALYTDLLVREDLLQLFGFSTMLEKEWHKLLMGVQGIGAKASMAILGALGPDGVSRAITLGDWNAIKAAKGVGPKTAQKVVIELKDKAPGVMAMGGTLTQATGEAEAQVIEPILLHPMTQPDPTLRPERRPEDADRALRPQGLEEFIGQAEARANLRVFIESAKQRGEAMDHTLFHGPPGLGKTTLAQIMARELGVNFRMTSGPVLAKAGDLAAILTNLEPRDVLFVDEIHRLNPVVEEILYPALEDFELDLVIGEGPAARTVRIELQPFTLVGATTRLGLLTTPLRDRFGIPTRLQFYTTDELHEIVRRGARLLGIQTQDDGAREIARRARGTPRIAGRLLRRVVDFALVEGDGTITRALADSALTRLGVDHLGLDGADRRYLKLIAENYQGGPVGVETMSAALSESRDALEEVIEPYLLQQGLIQRTPRGRMLAAKAWTHLGLAAPKSQTNDLFEG